MTTRVRCHGWALIAGVILPWSAISEGLPLSAAVRSYWVDCAAKINEPADRPLRARRFGSTPEMSDLLLGLVLAGEKTITSTSPWLYDGDLQAAPAPGDYWVVMDGVGEPSAVLRTTGVKTLPMNEVTQQDSQLEGPSVRSIEAWRKVHWKFFTR
ncbi:MAG TPA: ASCH domain-containing protein, partial [Steroidobacteraceae bacterium]|nr:ASCH domain-containing protein [Steroidobacteraceae bacterium]